MAFDPDEFLQKTAHLEPGHGNVTRDKSVTGFDPDAFLAQTADEGGPDVGQGESFARGAGQGLSMGFADEITGGLEHLFTGKDYRTARDESRANYKAAEAANPKTYMGGQVTGAVAPLLIPGVGEVSAAKLLAQGAVQGVGDSEAEDFGGMAKDAAKGAAIQGAFLGAGKLASPVLRGAGRLASKGLARAEPGLESLTGYTGAKAAGFTKALRKKFGVQETNELGRWMVDKGLITAGADTSDMIARTEALKKLSGDRIGEIIKDMDVAKVGTPNAGKILDTLTTKMREVEGVEAAKPVLRQYQTAIRDIQRFKRKPSYEGLQKLKKTYGDLAFPKGVVTEARPGIVDTYHAIKTELERSVDEGVKALGRPDVADIYRSSKKDYGSAKLAMKGLREKEATEQGNRWIKPTDFIAGAGIGIGTGSLPVTAATLVAKRAAETYGPQATAVAASKLAPTAAKLSAMVAQAPQKLGRFAPAIKNAVQRGPAAVTSTHFILMQQDPEYRQMMLKDEEGGDGR